MQDLLNTAGPVFPTPFIRSFANWHRLWSTLFVLPTLLLIIDNGGFAAPVSPMVAKSTFISPVDGGKVINVVLSLPLSDPQGAAEFVRHASVPNDPLYHRYLTPQEFADRFGANAADYAVLKDWAASNGLQLAHESVARTTLTVRGTVAQLQSLFKAQLNNYRSPDGQEFYSASITPIVPDAISSKVSGVIGLTASKQYASHAKIHKTFGEVPDSEYTDATKGPATAGGTGPGGAFSAADLRTAYSIPAYGSVSEQTVAVFEQGGFTPSDVETYLTKNRLPHRKVTVENVNGYDGSVNNPAIELEAVLDIDMVIGINPNVTEVLVYEDGNDTFPVALLDAITQVGDDNKAQTLSISYGQDEYLQGTDAIAAESAAFTQLAVEGITVTVSAGDQGAYGDFSYHNGSFLNVPDPGSQPDVTCVGGTTLFTGPNERYGSEDTWNLLGVGFGATGGGVSLYWPLPSYQQPAYVTFNGGSSTYRNVPDVAAVGNPETGVAVYSKINGGWLQVGGTSVGAPLWGSFLSIVNAAFDYIGQGRIGFINPTLYSLGFGYPTTFFRDVIDGTNGNQGFYGLPGFNAGAGYDTCTGIGSLWGTGLAFQILTSLTQPGTPPSALNGLATRVVKATSVTLQWHASNGATGYVVNLFHYTGTYQWNISQSYLTKKTTISITGLAPNTNYYAYVGAVNQSGAAQNNIMFTTPK
jgi:subtilase family serine protease